MIRNDKELKAAMDQMEIDSAVELLNHDCWAVVHWFAYGVTPQVIGTFRTQPEALAERDRIHAQGMRMPADIRAVHGDPITEIVPVFPPGE